MSVTDDCKVRFSTLPSSNFLVCASDDKVRGVHGNHISSELAREVVFLVQLSPLDI